MAVLALRLALLRDQNPDLWRDVGIAPTSKTSMLPDPVYDFLTTLPKSLANPKKKSTFLKGQSHEIFDPRIFSSINSSWGTG
jgi:hypothetical protein